MASPLLAGEYVAKTIALISLGFGWSGTVERGGRGDQMILASRGTTGNAEKGETGKKANVFARAALATAEPGQ